MQIVRCVNETARGKKPPSPLTTKAPSRPEYSLTSHPIKGLRTFLSSFLYPKNGFRTSGLVISSTFSLSPSTNKVPTGRPSLPSTELHGYSDNSLKDLRRNIPWQKVILIGEQSPELFPHVYYDYRIELITIRNAAYSGRSYR